MPTPQQIHDDLRPHLRGTVRVDDVTRQLHSTDASPFQILPAAMVVPADEDDVHRVMKYAYENSIPIVPRGAGTGLAGQCLTPGIVLDLSVHFRRIEAIGPDWVRVQPGVTLAELNAGLAKQGRQIRLPNTVNATATLGGLIADNAGNDLRAQVMRLKIVMDNGDTEEFSLRPDDDSNLESPRATAFRELIEANRELIAQAQPKPPHNRVGYAVRDGIDHNGRVTLLRLFAGSEGTLGIILEATLATVPVLAGHSRLVAGYATIDEALPAWRRLNAVGNLMECDLLDQRMVSFARTSHCELIIPPGCATVLVLKYEAVTPEEVLVMGRAAEEAVMTTGGTILHAATSDPVIGRRIERFFEAATFGFYAMSGPRRPMPFIDDIVLDTEHHGPFLQRVQELLRQADLAAAVHIKLPVTIHCRVLVDLTNQADQSKAWALADAVHALALSLDGVIGSRHGIGLARTPWMEKQAGPLYPLFREVKRIFDPRNILNPGKIVGPDPSRPAWPFRSGGQWSVAGARGQGPVVSEKNRTEVAIPLTTLDQIENEVTKCNACGDCRVRSSPSRMCPLFRVTGDEDATPRAKANLLRSVLASEDPDRIEADDVKTVAKLCIQCGQCKDECKAGVDIPHLMLETKAAHYAAHGFDRHEWLIARSERLSGLAATFAFTSNILLGMTSTRWLFEKLFGLARKRMLHRYTHRTFLRRRLVQRFYRRLPTGPKKIAYFVDTFANQNDPLLAEATVAVLEHHGFVVHVPRRQRGSGMPALSVGDADTARARAAYNVPSLAEFVRDGYTILCSEPSAALALTQEYPRLLPNDDDAKLVAANTVELTAFLNDLRTRGELKPLTRELSLHVGHHVPCQLKSLGRPIATQQLLESIPGLSVQTIDVGCSGMAGLWGFAKSNFDMSMTIGEPVFAAMKVDSIAIATSECSSCRLQLQQGTGKRALHPVQLLALGYDLVPQLEARLTRPLHPRLTG